MSSIDIARQVFYSSAECRALLRCGIKEKQYAGLTGELYTFIIKKVMVFIAWL